MKNANNKQYYSSCGTAKQMRNVCIGHAGCVNCLEWNSSGELLASGSDDKVSNLKKKYEVPVLPSCCPSVLCSLLCSFAVSKSSDIHSRYFGSFWRESLRIIYFCNLYLKKFFLLKSSNVKIKITGTGTEHFLNVTATGNFYAHDSLKRSILLQVTIL
jgi:WD40 repeat protein